jgi:nitrite reductase (NO-forming)
VPGTFILVDHSIFRAFNKGALGMIEVGGMENAAVYSGRQLDEVYLPEGGAIQTVGAEGGETPAPATSEERIARGAQVFATTCAACHQLAGQGIPAAFPPLAASDYLNADKPRAIATVLFGLTGEIVVNGQTFNSVMPALSMSNEDVANVMTYVYNNWNNAGHDVTPAEVAAVRAAGPPPGAAAGMAGH